MRLGYGGLLLLLLAASGCSAHAANGVQTPPPHLGLPSYYTKYIDASGIPIVSNSAVDDAALYKMQRIVNAMLNRDASVKQQVQARLRRVLIIPKNEGMTSLPEYANLDQTSPLPGMTWNQRAQGVAWTDALPYVSCSEANLLHSGYPLDRYTDESICIHEMAHTVFDAGIVFRDPDVQNRLSTLYNAAIRRGMLANTYAGTNTSEYWAESVQAWFNAASCSNRNNTPICTQTALYQLDPSLWKEIKNWFPTYAPQATKLFP
jgi:hypothetical protein